jgi:hypothetical protein
MDQMELHEAQLFRMLSGLFGNDRVLFNMRALAVCGGSLPTQYLGNSKDVECEREQWAKNKRCLFTIVDEDDHPKLVIDFYTAFSEAVDVQELEDRNRLQPLLNASGVCLVLMTKQELDEILTPSSGLCLVSLLQDRWGLAQD